MADDRGAVRLSLVVSPEVNDRLEELAATTHTTKSDILRKALALFDVASEAKAEKHRVGILDENKQLVREIVGF